MEQDKEEILKMRLKSVTNTKMCKAREELALRNLERTLSEELTSTKIETQFMFDKLEDLKHEISKLKYQIIMIGICEASEKSKIENHIANIKYHQNGFDNLFSKEIEAIEIKNLEIKKRKEQEKELEQQEKKIIEEKNQLLQRETKSVEEECDALAQQCVVLQNRNNAIILRIRRQLIEAEDKRRCLINVRMLSESKS